MADKVKYLPEGPSIWDPSTEEDHRKWALQMSGGRVADAFRDLRIDDRTGNPFDPAWLPHGMGGKALPSYYEQLDWDHNSPRLTPMVKGDWLNPISIQAGVRELPISPLEMMYSSRDEPKPKPKKKGS